MELGCSEGDADYWWWPRDQDCEEAELEEMGK